MAAKELEHAYTPAILHMTLNINGYISSDSASSIHNIS